MLFLIVYVLHIPTLTAAAAASTLPSDADYADSPTVWCQYSAESIALHRDLMHRLPETESLDKTLKGANLAVAQLNDILLECAGPSASTTFPPYVFVSNHIHDFEKGASYDCHRTRGFPHKFTQEAKKVNTALATIKLFSRSNAWFSDFIPNLRRIEIEVMGPAHDIEAGYSHFDALENNYLSTYPFRTKMSATYPCFDSEASIARLVDFKLTREELSSAAFIELHIHSRFNPCFFCLQNLHYYAQRWAELTKKGVRIFISSHTAYPMPADIMPAGHVIPGDTMLTYGTLLSRELTAAELEDFTYAPDHPGKIIQMFFPSSPSATADTAAAAATASESAADET